MELVTTTTPADSAQWVCLYSANLGACAPPEAAQPLDVVQHGQPVEALHETCQEGQQQAETAGS